VLGRVQIEVGIGLEFLQASRAAEIIRSSVEILPVRGRPRVHLHAANRIGLDDAVLDISRRIAVRMLIGTALRRARFAFCMIRHGCLLHLDTMSRSSGGRHQCVDISPVGEKSGASIIVVSAPLALR
jgi:hypothetical protein